MKLRSIYRLYANVGIKIKWLAIILFIACSKLSIIMGLLLVIDSLLLPDESMFGGGLWWLGLLLIVFGPMVSLLGTWFLYGYGELIDKTCDNTRISARAYMFYLKKNEPSELAYRREIWRLYDDCLITHGEYEQTFSKDRDN